LRYQQDSHLHQSLQLVRVAVEDLMAVPAVAVVNFASTRHSRYLEFRVLIYGLELAEMAALGAVAIQQVVPRQQLNGMALLSIKQMVALAQMVGRVMARLVVQEEVAVLVEM
jgi:hypothetical protein